MAQKLSAGMPQNLDLDSGYSIAFTAVDAVSGAVVAAVKVSNAILLVENVSTAPDADLAVGPFMLVPGPDA